MEENFYIFYYEHFSANREIDDTLQIMKIYYVKNSTNVNIDLNSLNTAKTMTYDIENPDPGLGEEHKCSQVKPVYRIPTIPS